MLRDFWRLAKPFWTGDERRRAWGLAILVVLLTLANVYVLTRLTYYNGEYGDAIQEKNLPRFLRANGLWFVWVLVWTGVYVYQTYFQQLLGVRWRRWLTRHLLQTWLTDRTYYYWRFAPTPTDNPDQRISEDAGSLIDNTLALFVGALQALTSIVTYTIILWGLSGVYPLPVGGGQTVPVRGYLVYLAYFWCLFSSWLTWLVGRRLVGLNAQQQRFEADFRFGLVRVRENSESIALGRGEPAEDRGLQARFGAVVGNTLQIMQRNKQVNAVGIVTGYIGGQASYFLAGPLYFRGMLTYGDLIKINGSFYIVQQATFFFVTSYAQIALWQAIVRRLTEFGRTAADAKATARAQTLPTPTEGDTLAVNDLSLRLPDGTPLADGITLTLAPGDSLLVTGPSGAGKSTLLRAIAGIWPYAEGGIRLPADFGCRSMVLPQKPYLPIGTLRAALAYPADPADFARTDWPDLLRSLRLDPLAPRLDDTEDWSQVLSGGEGQRVAFAHVLLHKPQWLFLDEATSALDEPTEHALYTLLRQSLPDTAILSIGHRASLHDHHTRHLVWSGGARRKRPRSGYTEPITGAQPVPPVADPFHRPVSHNKERMIMAAGYRRVVRGLIVSLLVGGGAFLLAPRPTRGGPPTGGNDTVTYTDTGSASAEFTVRVLPNPALPHSDTPPFIRAPFTPGDLPPTDGRPDPSKSPPPPAPPTPEENRTAADWLPNKLNGPTLVLGPGQTLPRPPAYRAVRSLKRETIGGQSVFRLPVAGYPAGHSPLVVRAKGVAALRVAREVPAVSPALAESRRAAQVSKSSRKAFP